MLRAARLQGEGLPGARAISKSGDDALRGAKTLQEDGEAEQEEANALAELGGPLSAGGAAQSWLSMSRETRSSTPTYIWKAGATWCAEFSRCHVSRWKVEVEEGAVARRTREGPVHPGSEALVSKSRRVSAVERMA